MDNGRVLFTGPQPEFISSSIIHRISHSTDVGTTETPAVETIEKVAENATSLSDDGVSDKESNATTPVKSATADNTLAGPTTVKKRTPRKLIEDEARAVGRVKWEIVRVFIITAS